MAKVKKKGVDNVSKAFGIISIILLFIILILPIIPIPFVIFIIAFGYTIYKTLYKKGSLSRSEKIAFIIILIILVIPMILGILTTWARLFVLEQVSG